jgi:hypothetical protein
MVSFWRMLECPVGYKALEQSNRDCAVKLGSAALRFAWVRTDPATDARERNGLLDELDCFLEPAGGDQGHIALHMNPARTGVGARGFALLVDHSAARLGTVHQVNGPMVASGHSHWADLKAIFAGCALFQAHVSRLLPQFHLERPGFTPDAADTRVCPDCHVGVLGNF